MTFAVYVRYIETDDFAAYVGAGSACRTGRFWSQGRAGGPSRFAPWERNGAAAFEANIDGCSGGVSMMRSLFAPVFCELVIGSPSW